MNYSYKSLKILLSVKEEDEALFDFYYSGLRLYSKNNTMYRSYAVSSRVKSKKEVFYSYYVDILARFFRISIPVLNLNCCASRYALVKKQSASRLRRMIQLVLFERVDFVKYYRGLVSRNKLFEPFNDQSICEHHELWKIICSEYYRVRLSKCDKKLVWLYEKVGVKSVYAVDFSDSIYMHMVGQAKKKQRNNNIIPHGYIQDFSELYTYGRLADRYICWSSTEARDISRYLIDVRAEYYGCLRYSKDYVAGYKAEWRANSLLRDRKRVVFFSNPLSQELVDNDVISSALAVLKGLNIFFISQGVDFFVKLHPWDEGGDVANLCLDIDIECINGVLPEVLLETDLVIGFQSTTLYEAVVLGLKALQIVTPTCKGFKFDYVAQIDCFGGELNKIMDILEGVEVIDQNLGFDQEKISIPSL